jgi:methylenetetrahydrofolate--tRNA-(uracil-5-)-methyltransferase
MRLRSRPHIRFAGQITGVEGYVESAAMGLLAGRMAAAEIAGHRPAPVPRTTAMGALVHHITGGAEAKTFQPMNVNFGLFPPLDGLAAGGAGGATATRPIPTAPRPIGRPGWAGTPPPPNDLDRWGAATLACPS